MRSGVKDIQSEAIMKSANSNVDLGDGKLVGFRMGKWMEVETQEGFDIENLCEKLLANTVIEEYKVERIET